MLADVRCVVDGRDGLGEGVFWSVRDRAVYWVDIAVPSCIQRWTAASGRHETFALPEMAGSAAQRTDGTLLVATHTGLHTVNFATGAFGRVAGAAPHATGIRANDGGVDPRGRFWYGTMQNNFGPGNAAVPVTASVGTLLRVGPGMAIAEMAAGIGIPNALCWAPDGRTMYFADTLAGEMVAYDFHADTGSLSNRRAFGPPGLPGHPDGATVDADGYVWNARWDGGCVVRLAPDGRLDRTLELPVQRPTCCAFGDDDLGTLYVTSSRIHLSADELAGQPLAGGLFAVRAGVRGLPRPEFEG